MTTHGRNRLVKACRVLVCKDGAVRDRLVEAAQLVQASLAAADQWPPDVRDRAVEIVRECHRAGSLRATIDALDDDAALRLAEEIVTLVERAEHITIADIDCD